MRERRSHATEFRAEGRTISGYAAKFKTLSEDLGGFVETIAPGAFDLVASTDVILNYDHENRDVLGRTASGTLKLTQDDVGLFFECVLPERSPTIDVAGLIEQIGRQDIKGCSFAFNVADEHGDEWGETNDGRKLRTIVKAILYDVCPTPCPAYQDTEVAVRSFQRIQRSSQESAARRVLEYCRRRLRLAEILAA
jgi:HK97 family phage prohead protease